ncbi:MAG: FG-GAP repeat protein, partial [Pirellulales bacterium]
MVLMAAAVEPVRGAIVERLKLTASDAMEGDLFGSSLAISGRTVVIGAIQAGRNENRQGAAYLFD